jgi:arabinosaccharide transport system permease protein
MSQFSSLLYNRKIAPFVFLAPFLAVFLLFKVWPVILAVNMSFQRFEGVQNQSYIGLANYNYILSFDRFFSALTNTTVYTIGTLLILIPLPLTLAVLLNSGRVVKATAFRVALFLPALASLVVTGTIFRLLLAREGFLNTVITNSGMEYVRWLETAELAIPSLLLLATWRWTGINMMYFNAGLVNIPKELYEAASIDGANEVQMFSRITLPLISPTVLFVLIISIIGGYQVFVEPLILYPAGNSPGDGALTMAMLIYRTGFTSFEFGRAAAMGVVLAAIIFTVSFIQFRLFGTFRRED